MADINMADIDVTNIIDYSYQPVSFSALNQTPGIYNNRTVLAGGVATFGPETSLLNESIWLKYNPNVIRINPPQSNGRHIGMNNYHVKVYGTFRHKNGQVYGHLGIGKSQLDVDKIIFCQKITNPNKWKIMSGDTYK